SKQLPTSLRNRIEENKVALLSFLSSQEVLLKIPPIEKGERSGKIPLSYSQERLWFIDKLQGSLAYHVPGVFRIVGGLDKNILEESIRFILRRHEVLRTLIVEEDGLGYQQVRGAEDFEIEVHVYREGEEDLGLLIEERVMS